MLRHLGYLASTQSIDASTCRTCRPLEATPDRIRHLIRDNLRDLGRILQFNAEHGIALYRVSSKVIPFGAYPENTVTWWEDFASELEWIAQFIQRYKLRLEMHPGHRTSLNSPSPETVALSILELGWHVRFLDAMQLDSTHKLVVQVGGTFGDKAGSLDRFVGVINGLPSPWKGRLVIENDDHGYGVSDILDAASRTGLPVVFGCRRKGMPTQGQPHSRGLIERCFASWKSSDGPPIVHLASLTKERPRPGTHPDWVEPCDLERMLALAPPDTPFDCLLEAQQGDRALFELRERMAIREYGALPRWRDASASEMV